MKADIDQRHINHSLDKVVSKRFQPQNIPITIKVDVRRRSTVYDLLPLSMLLGPAELPSVLPHTLVAVHREG